MVLKPSNVPSRRAMDGPHRGWPSKGWLASETNTWPLLRVPASYLTSTEVSDVLICRGADAQSHSNGDAGRSSGSRCTIEALPNVDPLPAQVDFTPRQRDRFTDEESGLRQESGLTSIGRSRN
jgi:hypothetical protein